MVLQELFQPNDITVILLTQGSEEGQSWFIHLSESLAVAPDLDLFREVRLCTRLVINYYDSARFKYNLVYPPVESFSLNINIS
jgi:hypothetical protein